MTLSNDEFRFLSLREEILKRFDTKIFDDTIRDAYKITGLNLATRLGISERDFSKMMLDEAEKSWEALKTLPLPSQNQNQNSQ